MKRLKQWCSFTRSPWTTLLTGILMAVQIVMAQDPKTELFMEADEAMQKAKEVQADLYSPTFFKTAQESYAKGEEGFQKGKNLEEIEKKLKMAAVYFMKAIESTKLAHTELRNAIRARNDALKVDGPRFMEEDWKEAESEFKDAVENLEENDLSGAKKEADKAERIYRKVELDAIKANYLKETWILLEEGKDSDVRKKAPLTLSRSEDLANKAEQLLIENRYDTDQVRELAKEAKYEAKHAAYLAMKIKELEDTDASLEAILLSAEAPLQHIADRLEVAVRFDQGIKPAEDEILHQIWVLRQTIDSQKQDINDKEAQIALLTQQIQDMESQLGDLKDKEQNLAQLMEKQKLAREKYEKVEKSFTEAEAEVLRMGDKVIIRLYGLSFDVGKSTIDPKYFGLLSKVVDAFNLYPGCGVTVEGHTDSYGTDDANQKLSTERAAAVQKYLIAAAGIEESRIMAVGYGESKPVASNETRDGRRKNRRIDIVIHPKE